jgi:hypothetical protein
MEGDPWAGVPSLKPSEREGNQLALELGVPGRGLEEFMMGASQPGGFAAACAYFGLPEPAIALQLANGQAWGTIPPAEWDRADKVLRAPGHAGREVQHLRRVLAAA